MEEEPSIYDPKKVERGPTEVEAGQIHACVGLLIIRFVLKWREQLVRNSVFFCPWRCPKRNWLTAYQQSGKEVSCYGVPLCLAIQQKIALFGNYHVPTSHK